MVYTYSCIKVLVSLQWFAPRNREIAGLSPSSGNRATSFYQRAIKVKAPVVGEQELFKKKSSLSCLL